MYLSNPFIGSEPVQMTVICQDGSKTDMSVISTSTLSIPDESSEVLARWRFRGQSISKAWISGRGWMEIDEYMERKRFEEEKAKLEADKLRVAKRAPKKAQNEDLTPPADNGGTDAP